MLPLVQFSMQLISAARTWFAEQVTRMTVLSTAQNLPSMDSELPPRDLVPD